MRVSVSVSSATSTLASVPPAQPTAHGWGFRDILSALNPLQYVPVVGTIYRAVTGDTIPEGLRIIGSLTVGVALSGPIGLVTGIGAIIAEKATGIDPDKIARNIAVALGIVSDKATASAVVAKTAPAVQPPASQPPALQPQAAAVPAAAPSGAAPAPAAATPTAAVPGVDPGVLAQSMQWLSAADRLNAHELLRIHAAYSKAAALT